MDVSPCPRTKERTTYHQIPKVHSSVHLRDVEVGISSWAGTNGGGEEIRHTIALAALQLGESGTESGHEICEALSLGGSRGVFVIDITVISKRDQLA